MIVYVKTQGARIVKEAGEEYERKYRLKASGIDVDDVAQRAANISDIELSQVLASGKQPKVVQARSLLCYWATNELGISQPAISLSVARGVR